ncbi:glycoside hydrolase family 172 protein [Micromonospora echinospora]|uniref:glycoside hydrolase family 172 protein n=1 Tax=Micromonospora echinospora TaxID=1877 RepID=UPI003797E6AF
MPDLTSFGFLPPRLQPGLRSRSITAENPTGGKGAGGRTASMLGPGRKGRPCLTLPAGQTTTLADIDGPGRITHLWFTFPDHTDAVGFVLRDIVLRAYWDGETEPSVEVPIGDFFCCGFGARALVTSMPILVAPSGGMNCYFPMPFGTNARLTVTNEHPVDVDGFFFQIDYELSDHADEQTGRFHAQWRRQNPTTAGRDYTILDNVTGRGAYVGTYLAITALQRHWWGEGEVKFYLDGDEEYPTICGTGTEDYAGGAWAFQDRLSSDQEPQVLTFNAPFCGYPQRLTNDPSRQSVYATAMAPSHGLYRWHLPDPIHFTTDLRVTLQQIGQVGPGIFERSDDVSSVAYWYQHEPHTPFPAFPSRDDRTPR